MCDAKLSLVSLVVMVCIPQVRGQEYPPIVSMEQVASLVVMADVTQVIEPGGKTTANVTVQLQVIQTLKGTATSSLIVASIPALSRRPPTPVTFPATMVGQTGIWFLKSGSNGYQILPRKKDGYSATELFLPLTGTSASPPASTLDDELLAYLVLWYQSLDLSKVNDTPLLSSFEPWNAQSPTPQQVATAVQPLLASASVREQIVGLTAELRVGSADALNVVVNNLAAFQSQPQFSYLTSAIGLYPKYKSASWIAPLKQLVLLHTTVPGMDSAAVGALVAIGTKQILPVMAQLLDSADPQAQLGAAAFFGRFSLFGGTDGVIHSGPRGPFATAQTMNYMPKPGASIPVAQYVVFWKNWWIQNQSALGFVTQ